MAYCSKCGTQLSEGANFCPKCGNPCDKPSEQLVGDDIVAEQKKTTKLSSKTIMVILIVITIFVGGWFVWKKTTKESSLMEEIIHDEGLGVHKNKHGKSIFQVSLAKALVNYKAYCYNTGVPYGEEGIELPYFHEGLSRVMKDNNKWGFIDISGKEVIPCIYDRVNMFLEGLAGVNKDGKYGYIDKSGKEVIPCIYEWGNDFHEGLAVVKKDGKYGFIDKAGKEITAFIYDDCGEFHEGLASVNKDGKYGYIDKSGKEVIPCIYEWGNDFHEGLAVVKKDGKYGFIDKAGKEITAFIYDDCREFYEGLAGVKKDGKYGFIDKAGKEITAFIYDWCREFHEGLLLVEKDEKCGYIDNSGKEVIPCIYEWGNDFHEGLAGVKKDGKWVYIDKSGKEIIHCNNDCEYALGFHEGFARIRVKQCKFGFIDKTGNKVIPFIYDYASDFSRGLAFVLKDDVIGVVDIDGHSSFDIVNASIEEREESYEEINQYSRYVGKWQLRKTTDEGRKMLIEITLKENKSGDMVVFNDRGNVADVIAYEEYPQCILEDGVIYMTKNGVITKGSPKLRVSSDGLYSYDGIKYTRESEIKPR